MIFKKEIIEFYCDEKYFGSIPEPVPAFKKIPNWFKKLQNSCGHRDSFGQPALTAKRCIPMLDALSTGWILSSHGDVTLRVSESGEFIEDISPKVFGSVVEYHSIDQLGGKNSPTYPGPAVKFINHWVVKTAPGYSCLFVPCLNHLEEKFTLFSGVVDTDNYPKEVNFPGILHGKDTEIYIPAGTPLMQVIPFKRNDIKREAPVRVMSGKEKKFIEKLSKAQQSRRHVYTNELREDRK